MYLFLTLVFSAHCPSFNVVMVTECKYCQLIEVLMVRWGLPSGYGDSFPQGKRQGREANHSSPFSTAYLHYTIIFHGLVLN